MSYTTKGKCVYKIETGEKVGCTEGSVEKYLAALHTNINEESNDFEWLDDIDEELDFNLWERVADAIDNLTSGPTNPEVWATLPSVIKLGNILVDFNLHLDDLSGFFSWDTPTDYDGNPITSYQLRDLERKLKAADLMWEDEDLMEQYFGVIREDFDWVDDIPAELTPGEKYYFKTGNGMYWEPLIYGGLGKTKSDGETLEGHRFKDINDSTERYNRWMSKAHVQNLIEKGDVKSYDPEWTIMDDVEFGSINDIEGRNFVIYFENGIDIDDTIELQKKLQGLGFHFPGREGKVATSEDTKERILMFECYNWDTSNDRYTRMPSDFRDKGLMLMVADKQGDRWGTRNPVMKEQERFSTVIDHNAVVVNGYEIMKGDINESEDFDWVKEIEPVDLSFDGEYELFIDIKGMTSEEKKSIFNTLQRQLGELNIHQGVDADTYDEKIHMCSEDRMVGIIMHCGTDENDFTPQRNVVCCMTSTLEQTENEYPETVGQMRHVDGKTILGTYGQIKENLTEGFYYKGINPTVDLVVIRNHHVLLIKRGDESDAEPGKWALPGGFHDTKAKEGEEWRDDKENSLDAAKREVKEETGLDVNKIGDLEFKLVGLFEGGERDPRDNDTSWSRSTTYAVRIPEEYGDDVKGMDDAQRAEWVPIDLVLQRKLAFDHDQIIKKALQVMGETEYLKESNDFEWTEEVPSKDELPKVYIGMQVVVSDTVPSSVGTVLTVHDIFNNEDGMKMVRMSWGDDDTYDYTYGSVVRFTDRGGIWKKIVKESNDFEWAEEIPANIIGIGDKIRHKNNMDLITVTKIEGDRVWFDVYRKGSLSALQGQLDSGLYVKVIPDGINESNDFDWVRDIQPVDFDFNTVLGHTENKKTVVVWFGQMHTELINYITNYEEYGFRVVQAVQDDYIRQGTVKGLTFYPDGEMGYFTNRLDFHEYLDDVREEGAGDNLVIIDKTDIQESNDFDWVDDVGVTDEAIRDLMSNCEDIPVTNYNLSTKSPYIRRGKMNVFYYSMCPYWWDMLKDLPLDDDGRGKGEWFRDDDNGERKVAVIMPDRGGVTDIRGMGIDDFSAITYDLDGISNYFNGRRRGELWIFLDDEGNPRYDLVPDNLVDEVRQGFEGVTRHTKLEESNDFSWVDNVKPKFGKNILPEVGDTVTTIPGFGRGGTVNDLKNGGAGYKENYTFIVGRLTNHAGRPVVWPENNPNSNIVRGVYAEALTLVKRKERVLESNDFEWAEEHQPWEPGGKYVIDFTTEDEDTGGYLGFKERRNRQDALDRLEQLGYKAKNIRSDACFYYLENYKLGDKWAVDIDDCVDTEYVYEMIDEDGFEIISPTQFFEMTSGSILP